MTPSHVLIGREVKRARIEAQLTQCDLAELLHVEQSAISRIENGQQQLSYQDALKLKPLGFKIGKRKWR